MSSWRRAAAAPGRARRPRAAPLRWLLRRPLATGLVAAPGLLAAAHLGYALLHQDLFLYGMERFLRYYLAPGMIALAYFVVVARAGGGVRAQVAAYAYAVIGALLLFELYPQVAPRGGAEGDRLDQAIALRAGGWGDAYPAFPVVPVNALAGGEQRASAIVSNLPAVPTALCRGDDGWVWYRADAGGFNNPPAAAGAPVAVLGDSFIQGICLREEDSIVGQLRQRGLAARSFGILGHGPLLELETLIRHVRPHQPPEVVWCYYEGNDLQDLEREAGIPWLRAALDAPSIRPPRRRGARQWRASGRRWTTASSAGGRVTRARSAWRSTG